MGRYAKEKYWKIFGLQRTSKRFKKRNKKIFNIFDDNKILEFESITLWAVFNAILEHENNRLCFLMYKGISDVWEYMNRSQIKIAGATKKCFWSLEDYSVESVPYFIIFKEFKTGNQSSIRSTGRIIALIDLLNIIIFPESELYQYFNNEIIQSFLTVIDTNKIQQGRMHEDLVNIFNNKLKNTILPKKIFSLRPYLKKTVIASLIDNPKRYRFEGFKYVSKIAIDIENPINKFLSNFLNLDPLITKILGNLEKKRLLLDHNLADIRRSEGFWGRIIGYAIELRINLYLRGKLFFKEQDIVDPVTREQFDQWTKGKDLRTLLSIKQEKKLCKLLFKLLIKDDYYGNSIPEGTIEECYQMSESFFKESKNLPLFSNQELQQKITTNPHFHYKLYEGYGDFLINQTLIEIKSGFKPTKRLIRSYIYQLLVYLLLDVEHTYQIKSIGIYFSRFNYFWKIEVETLFNTARPLINDFKVFKKLIKKIFDDQCHSSNLRDEFINNK